MATDAARARGRSATTIAGARDRVPLRAVRRHARAAERQADPGRSTSTTCSPTAPASPASRPATSASGPNDPDMIAMPDVGSFTPLPWKPNARLGSPATSPSRARSGRTARARSCATRSTRAADAGLRVQDRARARVLPRAPDARTAAIEIADQLDTLEQPCYDIAGLTRNYDFVADGLRYVQRARLGQLRERPRGRQRAVRAELRATPTR